MMMPAGVREDLTEAAALAMDERDPLAWTRELFHIPPSPVKGDVRPSVYLCGNSLGLQPIATRQAVLEELDDWARLGVEGHFHARRPWMPYHEFVRDAAARLVGALPHEVVVMNSLTVNLHLMMATFYRPTQQRWKIMVEADCFPSDSHAVWSQARWHGLDPERAVVRLRPRDGESVLRTADIIEAIEREGPSLALVMLGGVNYLTGQWFEMEPITSAARRVGAVCGWDLAHAAGNVPVRLHDLGADFAAWCSYKYLNSGPGAVAGCFVHERHARNTDLVRFAGWWGHDQRTRFQMGPEFVAMPSADGWQLSNPPILAMAPVKVSLEIFDRVGIDSLREKSLRLTAYLERLIGAVGSDTFEIVTPRDPAHRGCQLSLGVKREPRRLFDALQADGVACDYREPNVVRVAPAPLYNTFHDCWRFAEILRKHARA